MNAQDTNSIFGTEEASMIAPTSDEKTTALLSHILTLIPGIGFIAPLVIYLVKKNESSYVAFHSRESLNFQITLYIAYIISIILCVILIGFLLLAVIGVVHLVLVIVATIRASEGVLYRYPVNIRLV